MVVLEQGGVVVYFNILLTIITLDLTILAFYTIYLYYKDYKKQSKTLMRKEGIEKYYEGIREKVNGT